MPAPSPTCGSVSTAWSSDPAAGRRPPPMTRSTPGDAKRGDAREPPPVAELRRGIARLFGYVEDVVYVGLAALLGASALALLGSAAVLFWRSLASGSFAGGIVELLDQLLLVLMVVEILYT